LKRKTLITGYASSRRIFINGEELLPRRSQKVYNHSPNGFNWGYGGSGPAQLALAVLLEFTSEDKALLLHQDFKWDIIAKLPQDKFGLTIDINKWIEKYERKEE